MNENSPGPAVDVSALIEALEPSGSTKAAYHGEFSFALYEGESDAGIELYRNVYVPWDTIKEIMAAIRKRAVLTSVPPASVAGMVEPTPERHAEVSHLHSIGSPASHVVKTWPPYFEDICSGAKTFEVRRNDRGYAVGDILDLVEYDPKDGASYGLHHSGRNTFKRVTYILPGGQFGIEPGYIVMALADYPEVLSASANREADGYAAAFYEIADMLGIGARAASPKTVWEGEMRPALQKLLTNRDAASAGVTKAGTAAQSREYGYLGAIELGAAFVMDLGKVDEELVRIADVQPSDDACCKVRLQGTTWFMAEFDFRRRATPLIVTDEHPLPGEAAQAEREAKEVAQTNALLLANTLRRVLRWMPAHSTLQAQAAVEDAQELLARLSLTSPDKGTGNVG